MKKLNFLFIVLLLISCSDSEEQIIPDNSREQISSNNTEEPKSLILFGNKESVSKLIKNQGFDFLINEALSEEIPKGEEMVISCEFENDNSIIRPKKNKHEVIDTNPYSRTFRTFVGDEYISAGNNDSSAITKVQLANYCSTVIHIPFPVIIPVITPIVEKVYINVYFDNLTTQNIWGPAFSAAIDEWNAVLNDNTVNNYLDGSPQVYYRIAPRNALDYGNIEVLRVPSNGLVNSNSLAEARVGRYKEIYSGAGIFKHYVGKRMWVNMDKEGGLSLTQKKNVLLHEFGHSIGFLHTISQASNIEGTTQTGQSIFNMRDGIFRDQDLLAIDRIFNVPVEYVQIEGGCN
ncbi:hypothetical protein GCM10023311_01320 [Flaviramulus aquimarinus]|uniref:Dual-action HEIGH metallo-peptidase n=1 Tax=Flaviramulus aquimarinus TaxID=1170456 RepID=A0ABP9EQ55_9FLAO